MIPTGSAIPMDAMLTLKSADFSSVGLIKYEAGRF